MQYKVSFTCETQVDVWIDADSPEHAQQLVEANNPETYDRIRSSVNFSTGALRISAPSIVVNSVEED